MLGGKESHGALGFIVLKCAWVIGINVMGSVHNWYVIGLDKPVYYADYRWNMQVLKTWLS